MSAGLYFAFLCFAGAGLAVIGRRRGRFGWPLGAFVALSLCTTAVAELERAATPSPAERGDLPALSDAGGYVGSKACRSCHPGPYESWHRSFHRTMTQQVTPRTAVAPFDGVVHERKGRRYRFFREGDELYASVVGPGWGPEAARMRVVMSTGSHHYQVYWGAAPEFSEPVEIPLYWNIKEQRFIPKSDTTISPPGGLDGPGHWNSHCIRCHSVNGRPGFVAGQGRFESEVTEFGIACEACHGPGSAHASRHQNPAERYLTHYAGKPDPTIVNPANLEARPSSHVCGRCHGNFKQDMEALVLEGFPFTAGEDLEKVVTFYDLERPEMAQDEYAVLQSWRDGTSRTGGDEYNAHMKSPCFVAGEMSCVSCHSMHDSDPNDQLARGMDGDEACLQCHDDVRDRVAQHTHHAATSPGSRCYNCHMPHTTFALSTAMRSHRVDSPDIALSARTGRPNACNLCHLDKSLAWAASHTKAWYGAEDVELSGLERELAASVLWLLRGDAVQRAVAAWHMAWPAALTASGDDWQPALLSQLLDDPYAQVRYVAGDALGRLPGFEGLRYDFIGEADSLREAREESYRRWRAGRGGAAAARPAVLLRASGLDRETLAEVQRDRDDTPIDLPE